METQINFKEKQNARLVIFSYSYGRRGINKKKLNYGILHLGKRRSLSS